MKTSVSQKKLPVFAKRFRELRGDMTQDKFADFVGISRPTVGFYENGDRLPDALVLKKIAEKCHVSSDWLIGLSDNKKSDYLFIGEITGLNDNSIEFLRRLINEKINGLYAAGFDDSMCSPKEILNMMLNDHIFFDALVSFADAINFKNTPKPSLEEHRQVLKKYPTLEKKGLAIVSYRDLAEYKMQEAKESFESLLFITKHELEKIHCDKIKRGEPNGNSTKEG